MADLNTSSDRPEGITCEKYVRTEGKRCRHYLANGGCSLPDELMCVEWLKVNGHRKPAPASDKTNRDLFGQPLPAQPAKKPAKPQPEGAKAQRLVEVVQPSPEPEPKAPLRGLTTEDIESFKALRVEVCIHADDVGDVWLVPAYTGQPRKELTPEHLATITRVIEAFPGARVTAFEKSSANPAQEGSPA